MSAAAEPFGIRCAAAADAAGRGDAGAAASTPLPGRALTAAVPYRRGL